MVFMRAYARRTMFSFGGIWPVGRTQAVELGNFALVPGTGNQFERRDRRRQAIGRQGYPGNRRPWSFRMARSHSLSESAYSLSSLRRARRSIWRASAPKFRANNS